MLKFAKFSQTKQRFHDKTVLEAPFEKNSCALITSAQLIWENGDRNGRTENKIKGSKVHVHLRCNFCTSFAAPHRGSSSERWYAWNLCCRVSPEDKPFDLLPPIGYLHNSHQSIAAVTFESAPLSDGHSWDVVEMPDNGSAASICRNHREHRESEMRASDNFSLFFFEITRRSIDDSMLRRSFYFGLLCLLWPASAMLVLATFPRLCELPCIIPLKRFAVSLFILLVFIFCVCKLLGGQAACIRWSWLFKETKTFKNVGISCYCLKYLFSIKLFCIKNYIILHVK